MSKLNFLLSKGVGQPLTVISSFLSTTYVLDLSTHVWDFITDHSRSRFHKPGWIEQEYGLVGLSLTRK